MSLQSSQPPVSGTGSLGRSAMKPVTVVLAVADPVSSEMLLTSLRAHFRVVLPAPQAEHMRPVILKHKADVVVMDLESFPVSEVASLQRDFPGVAVVCVHRLADDALWSSALAAGALDCCHSSDVRGIVMAVNREGRLAQGHAA
jgi:DNA-binding NarL/FixJ family response regulator